MLFTVEKEVKDSTIDFDFIRNIYQSLAPPTLKSAKKKIKIQRKQVERNRDLTKDKDIQEQGT